jgi:hypothetical protein
MTLGGTNTEVCRVLTKLGEPNLFSIFKQAFSLGTDSVIALCLCGSPNHY